MYFSDQTVFGERTCVTNFVPLYVSTSSTRCNWPALFIDTEPISTFESAASKCSMTLLNALSLIILSSAGEYASTILGNDLVNLSKAACMSATLPLTVYVSPNWPEVIANSPAMCPSSLKYGLNGNEWLLYDSLLTQAGASSLVLNSVFLNTRMSVITSVPALPLKALDGKRIAPIKSACLAMASRVVESRASMKLCDTTMIDIPSGLRFSMVLSMNWLWMVIPLLRCGFAAKFNEREP